MNKEEHIMAITAKDRQINYWLGEIENAHRLMEQNQDNEYLRQLYEKQYNEAKKTLRELIRN